MVVRTFEEALSDKTCLWMDIDHDHCHCVNTRVKSEPYCQEHKRRAYTRPKDDDLTYDEKWEDTNDDDELPYDISY